MEEPSVTPKPRSDPDVHALEVQHDRHVEELALAADLIAAEMALIALLIHLRFPPRPI